MMQPRTKDQVQNQFKVTSSLPHQQTTQHKMKTPKAAKGKMMPTRTNIRTNTKKPSKLKSTSQEPILKSLNFW